MWLTNLFKKKKAEDSKPEIKKPKFKRVMSSDDLELRYMGSMFWDVQDVTEPELVDKIYKYLRSASKILVYVSNYGIEYSCWIEGKGQVNGSASLDPTGYFTFGIRKASTRYDLYLSREARKDPRCEAFKEWWETNVGPIVEEFQKDRNL